MVERHPQSPSKRDPLVKQYEGQFMDTENLNANKLKKRKILTFEEKSLTLVVRSDSIELYTRTSIWQSGISTCVQD